MTRKKKTPADTIEAKRLEKLNEELKSIFTEDIISKQYDKAKKKLDTWERKKFKGQGALGPIPSWFPNNEVIRLSKAREWLAKRWDEEKRKVSERSLKDIMEKMDAFRKHQKTGVPYDEKKYGHETYVPVSRVSFYEDVISAGPVEGLKMMVGPTMADHVQKHQRIKKGSTKGAEVRFGTQEERDEERQVFQNSIDKLHKIQPKWSHTALCKGVAPQFNVNYRTIYRRTDSPHAKK